MQPFALIVIAESEENGDIISIFEFVADENHVYTMRKY